MTNTKTPKFDSFQPEILVVKVADFNYLVNKEKRMTGKMLSKNSRKYCLR